MTVRRGSYGIDAPVVVAAFAAAVATCAAGVVVFAVLGITPAVVGLAISGIWVLCQLALYLHVTWRGKFVVWSSLLSELGLRGDERLLDMGCGRGAVLLAAAERLPNGNAVGVDLWRGVDQSGNRETLTRSNAIAEGVSDRVELCTSDMTDLPFPDGSFDVVVSNLAIHNIGSRAGRGAALDEALRVLRPGGRLMIADIRRAREYRDHLVERRVCDIVLRPLGWRMWCGGPWESTTMVTAVKPG
ncbi:class I SAM-dependent methyltransferase [Nocardia sp. NPDC051570]|uniref:class I SAM-dependent methyltransferase n=1 Tax=Nocardia sp. NPDC051570 TaxID=3364324 RepID=UPI00379B453C